MREGDILMVINYQSMHDFPWLERDILDAILRPAGATLVLWGDNPHLNRPASACFRGNCYFTPNTNGPGIDEQMIDFAQQHEDVFAYSQLPLWSGAGGGNGYIPGTNVMGFQDANHVSPFGSHYIGAYMMAAFCEWGLFDGVRRGSEYVGERPHAEQVKGPLLNRKSAALSGHFAASNPAFGAATQCMDGNANTYCHSNVYATDPWVSIELDEVQHIKSVEITNRLDCCADKLAHFQVWVGASSGAHAAPAVKCADETAGANKMAITVSCAAHGQFVTVLLPGSGRILNLAEVIVRG